MSNPISEPSIEPHPEGALCLRCGYNLRGLDAAGKCPECGIPVAESQRGPLMVHADRDWVRALYRGTQCMFWTVVGFLPAVLLVGLLTEFWDSSTGASAVVIVEAAVGLTILGLLCAGMWWVTQPDPRLSIVESQWSRRRLVRLAGAVSLVALITRGWLPPSFRIVANLLWMTGGYAMLIGCLRELQDIAARIPDPKSQKRARARVRELVVVGVIFLATVLAHRWAKQPGSMLYDQLRLVRSLMGLATLVLGFEILMSLDTLTRFRTALKRVLSEQPPAPAADSERA